MCNHSFRATDMCCRFCNKDNIKTKLPDDGSGSIPCYRCIYEGDNSYAVLCPEQYTPGHTLVILNDHKVDITDDIDETVFKDFSNTIRRVAEGLKTKATNHCGQNPDKIYVCMLSDGIEHLHTHLIPRYPFTERDKSIYRETFIPRDGVDEVEDMINQHKLGGFWYMALREREWKNSEFAERTVEERANILENLAIKLKIDNAQ